MKYLLSFVIALFLSTSLVYAQSQSIDMAISAIPSDPKPLQQVRLEVKSYAIDLNAATITWKSDGQLLDSGIGRTRLTVTAPTNGAVAVITASVSGIAEASATYILRPSTIDMLWEAADAYTPPFYKGKALPATNGLLRVTAIPGVSAPRNLVYQWDRNGSAQPSASGYGKSSFLFKNSELQTTERIGLEASIGSFVANSSIAITPRTPSLVAYQSLDGFIDYANGATKTLSTNQPGTIVRFEPFYFSVPKSVPSDLSFNFIAGDQAVAGTRTPNELRISRPEGGGSITIKATIDTVSYTLQHIERAFTLIFQ